MRLPPLVRKRRTWLVLLSVAGILALVTGTTACGGSNKSASNSTPNASASKPTLKLALDWFPNPDHVALFYALKKGYFTQAGVNVQAKTPSDPSAGLKLVATNKFDLAIYYEGDLFYAAAQNLPVTGVGALIPTPLNSMIALAGSKVKTLKDLNGATVGSAGLPFDGAVIQTISQREHFPAGAIKSVNVGYNLVPALLTHKADAIVGGYWNIEAVQVKDKTGARPVVFKMGQLGVPSFDELVVVANKNRLKSDAAYASAVRHFMSGLAKGVAGARAHPSQSIAIMKSSSSYTQQNVNQMVPLTLKALGQTGGTTPTCFSLAKWQTFSSWMLKTKLLKKQINPSVIATNAYNPNC